MKNLTLENVKVVSFDVFDTLIHRYLKNPTDLFDLVDLSCNTSLNSVLKGRFKHFRIKAESLARERNLARCGSAEVSFDDIYEQLANLLGKEKERLSVYWKKEIELEKMLVYADPAVLGFYKLARLQNKKIVLTSDMYLPQGFISELVQLAGYPAPERIYVSCEHGVSKADGGIFEIIARDFNVAPNDILHIGDNEHSDIQMAISRGCQVYHKRWPSPDIKRKLRFRWKKENIVTSLIEGVTTKILLDRTFEDVGDDLGLQVAGPLFVGHFLWLIQVLKISPVEKLLFFARDGYILEKMYGKYAKKFNISIPQSYFYISRAAIAPASFVDFNTDHFSYVIHSYDGYTISEVLDHMGINNPDMYANNFAKFGFKMNQKFHKGLKSSTQSMLSIYPDFIKASRKLRSVASSYIKEEVRDHKKIGIVDLGWSGTMQLALSKIAYLINPEIHISGFYLGRCAHPEFVENQPQNSFRSYLEDFDGSIAKGGAEILEFFYAAPHGTTLSYLQNGGKVEPLLEKAGAKEEVYIEKAQKHQKAAMIFVEEALNLIGKMPEIDLSDRAWSWPCLRVIQDPAKDEAIYYGDITHSSRAGSANEREKIAPDIKFHFLGNLNPKYRRAKKESYWRIGVRRRNK